MDRFNCFKSRNAILVACSSEQLLRFWFVDRHLELHHGLSDSGHPEFEQSL